MIQTNGYEWWPLQVLGRVKGGMGMKLISRYFNSKDPAIRLGCLLGASGNMKKKNIAQVTETDSFAVK